MIRWDTDLDKAKQRMLIAQYAAIFTQIVTPLMFLYIMFNGYPFIVAPYLIASSYHFRKPIFPVSSILCEIEKQDEIYEEMQKRKIKRVN